MLLIHLTQLYFMQWNQFIRQMCNEYIYKMIYILLCTMADGKSDENNTYKILLSICIETYIYEFSLSFLHVLEYYIQK